MNALAPGKTRFDALESLFARPGMERERGEIVDLAGRGRSHAAARATDEGENA